MTAAQRPWAADLLHFWFSKLRPKQWFTRDDRLDCELQRRYGGVLSAMASRPAREFLEDRRTAQAAILLFDQIPRNLHRGTPEAYAYDPLALAICKGAMARGWDRSLTRPQRQFLYMPLMHSEAIADQLLSLRKFTELGDAFVLGFARSHYRMIARFGRFPHRNALLGRESLPAEQRAIAAGHNW